MYTQGYPLFLLRELESAEPEVCAVIGWSEGGRPMVVGMEYPNDTIREVRGSWELFMSYADAADSRDES